MHGYALAVLENNTHVKVTWSSAEVTVADGSEMIYISVVCFCWGAIDVSCTL